MVDLAASWNIDVMQDSRVLPAEATGAYQTFCDGVRATEDLLTKALGPC